MIRASLLALALASVHASTFRAQRLRGEAHNDIAVRYRSGTVLQGPSCYRLTVGPWRPPLGEDTAYYRLPSIIRLDTVALDAQGRRLSPRMRYPPGSPSGFPRTPRWETSGDTVRLIWSNGFAATVVKLVRQGSMLRGEAVAESDAHPVPEPPRPHASVIAEPIACDSTQLR